MLVKAKGISRPATKTTWRYRGRINGNFWTIICAISDTRRLFADMTAKKNMHLHQRLLLTHLFLHPPAITLCIARSLVLHQYPGRGIDGCFPELVVSVTSRSKVFSLTGHMVDIQEKCIRHNVVDVSTDPVLRHNIVRRNRVSDINIARFSG